MVCNRSPSGTRPEQTPHPPPLPPYPALTSGSKAKADPRRKPSRVGWSGRSSVMTQTNTGGLRTRGAGPVSAGKGGDWPAPPRPRPTQARPC